MLTAPAVADAEEANDREVLSFHPYDELLEEDFDELPCTECAVPADLRQAVPAERHCHVCHLPGEAWYMIDNNPTSLCSHRTHDGHSICLHGVCLLVWLSKPKLECADVDSVLAPKVPVDWLSEEMYKALEQRMLCYNIAMKKTLLIAIPGNVDSISIKLKKAHVATKSARKR